MTEMPRVYQLMLHDVLPKLKIHQWKPLAYCPHPRDPGGPWGVVVKTKFGLEMWTIDGHSTRGIGPLAWRRAPHDEIQSEKDRSAGNE